MLKVTFDTTDAAATILELDALGIAARQTDTGCNGQAICAAYAADSKVQALRGYLTATHGSDAEAAAIQSAVKL